MIRLVIDVLEPGEPDPGGYALEDYQHRLVLNWGPDNNWTQPEDGPPITAEQRRELESLRAPMRRLAGLLDKHPDQFTDGRCYVITRDISNAGRAREAGKADPMT